MALNHCFDLPEIQTLLTLILHISSDLQSEPDAKSRPIRKGPDAGKDGGQEEKGTTEDEVVGWHHRLNGHELAQTLGDGEGQGCLACHGPWVTKSQILRRDGTSPRPPSLLGDLGSKWTWDRAVFRATPNPLLS